MVLLLDVRGVGQHDGAEIAGGGRGVDRAVEAVAHQQRQPPRVVDVGMAQHHAVDPPGIERQLRVQLVGRGALALEQPGVEQKAGRRRPRADASSR